MVQVEAAQPVEVSRAIARHVRISPRKARLVIDLIRGKSVPEAFRILQFTPKKAARIIYKVLQSAVANAENREQGSYTAEELFVWRCYVDMGPTRMWRRFRAGTRKVFPRRVHHSHITIRLAALPRTEVRRPKRPRA
ncbi:50S ribosomal protein L22 [bacterium HR11]|nr:50S ribosomal protein L22 [bacterium HR11]